jgi:hypothetical protein
MAGGAVLRVSTVSFSLGMKEVSNVNECKVSHFLLSPVPCEDCGKPLEELCGGIMVCKACGVAYDAIFFRPEGG